MKMFFVAAVLPFLVATAAARSLSGDVNDKNAAPEVWSWLEQNPNVKFFIGEVIHNLKAALEKGNLQMYPDYTTTFAMEELYEATTTNWEDTDFLTTSYSLDYEQQLLLLLKRAIQEKLREL